MIIYRKAKIDDLDSLVSLRVTFMKEVRKLTDSFDDTEIRQLLTEYFSKALKDQSFIAWLAELEGEIIGTSGLCIYQLPPSLKNYPGKTAYIMNMYTVPTHRGKGVATEIFRRTVEEAKASGCGRISLNATEMGRPLYEKFGFEPSHDEMVLTLG